MSAWPLAWAGLGVAAGTIVLALIVIRGRLMLIVVRGHSMAPTLIDGQRLLVVRRGSYRAGDVIMFSVPAGLTADVGWLVKRVAAVAGEPVPADFARHLGAGLVPAGRLLVRSDSPDGLDSRQLGLIDGKEVIGVARLPRGSSQRTRLRANSNGGPPLLT
jgi:signal peptidase I